MLELVKGWRRFDRGRLDAVCPNSAAASLTGGNLVILRHAQFCVRGRPHPALRATFSQGEKGIGRQALLSKGIRLDL